mmetsp:Transcript_63139/g.71487  ORF Transcript_63139/g.71487 Transcript_63139/m.71487 type:complete len:110 (-) Transcript_63139:106-435(-)
MTVTTTRLDSTPSTSSSSISIAITERRLMSSPFLTYNTTTTTTTATSMHSNTPHYNNNNHNSTVVGIRKYMTWIYDIILSYSVCETMVRRQNDTKTRISTRSSLAIHLL